MGGSQDTYENLKRNQVTKQKIKLLTGKSLKLAWKP